jgi:hypothetical protein
MISVLCTCGRRFKAEDQYAGKRTKCPICGNMLVLGQSPGIGPSGVRDNADVPSWWFPTGSAPKATTTVTPPPTRSGSGSGSGSDPDDLPTMIIPCQPGSRPGDYVGGRGRPPGSTQLDVSGPRASRLLAGLVGGALTAAVVGLSIILWLQTGGNGGGPAPNHPAAPPGQLGKGEGSEPNQLEATALARKSAPEPEPVNRADAGSDSAESAKSNEPSRLASREPAKLHLIVPAYFYPSGASMKAWQRLMDASSKAPIVVIANPSSGPGDLQDPKYAWVIDVASDKGVRIIGYVNTEYGKRLLKDAKNEIDRWIYFYPTVTGFFFDQQSVDAQDVGYYLELRDYARSKIMGKEALIVTNPGTTCDEEYFAKAVSDVTCLFTSFKSFDEFNPPVLLKHYSPSRFAALPYQVPNSNAMRQVLKEAVAKRIGYIYVTDAVSRDNPWGKLPAYWDDEVEAVRHAH